MKPACQISAEALRLGGEAVKPGVTTAQIDKIIYDYIVSQGARPNFKGLGGFPGSACISVNDVVIHGIPSHGIVLHEGDIVSIDTGAAVHGWNGDNAATFACGEVSETAQRLMDVTKEALMRGIAAAQTGNRVGDISAAVQQYVEDAGFSVVRISLIQESAFQASGRFTDLFFWKGLLLAAVIWVLTNVVKPTKKLHPIVYIAASAVVGIVFSFAGV